MSQLSSSWTAETASIGSDYQLSFKSKWDTFWIFPMEAGQHGSRPFLMKLMPAKVEIHGANGYLIDQFTQDTCNKPQSQDAVECFTLSSLERATAMVA